MQASDSRGRGRRRPPSAGETPAWRWRHRGGPLEQPINGSLVRAFALLLLVPLFLLALTIGRPGPFPAPTLPPSFDGSSATALAVELARDYPDRAPGSDSARDAAVWVTEQLGLYGLSSDEDAWDETIPGLGRVRLRNLVTVVRGARQDAILVVAHRDNRGVGPGANDNASGTAALIELARNYGRLGTVAEAPKPQHTIVFLSSDGGAFGGYGTERFASTSPLRGSIRAALSLDALAGKATPRLEIAGFSSRSPAPALTRTLDLQVTAQLGRPPARPGWLIQLVDLAVPFGYGEQAPFLGRKISAVRLAAGSDTDAAAALDTTARLDPARFARLGRAVESTLGALDGGIELAGGTAGHLYLNSRIIRGWSIEFVLLVSLVPFLAGVLDLLARCRRRRLPLRGAWRALRVRFGIWLWVAALVGAGAVAGVFPSASPIPPSPDGPAVNDWPVTGLVALGTLAGLGWWRGRRHLVPVEPATTDEVLAGYVVALAALGGVAVATAFLSPYGLLFLIPSLASWLWLPRFGNRPGWLGDTLFGLGLCGPAIAAVAVGTQVGLGLDTPLYLASLLTTGFIPWTTSLLLVAWAGVAAQLGALTAGRYRELS